MRQNLMAFPTTLMEAARIDGYDEMQIFWRIVMPNMKPALAALGIYMFMSAWNSFMWPLIILSTKDMYTFPVALATLDGNQWRKDYGVIMLGASITTLPIMAIFLIFQKQFIAGVMGGAIKE
ncbi:MAG: carbohydrate ABC transporter permease [Angelakisella sp.]